MEILLGGKSGHGRNGKHFYYGHPRQLHSDGKTHLQRCQLENVRAPRLEEIILNSLKRLIDKPGMIDHWLDVYTRRTCSELPALDGKVKSLENDIASFERKISNLVAGLSDLPQDVPAHPIYSQIKALTQKSSDLKSVKDRMQSEQRQITFTAIDRQGLIFKIRRTIQNLEKTPVELQRAVYANVIKFAELHPSKLKMALYAPTQTPETRKASGSSEALVRDGSCTVSFGARGRT